MNFLKNIILIHLLVWIPWNFSGRNDSLDSMNFLKESFLCNIFSGDSMNLCIWKFNEISQGFILFISSLDTVNLSRIFLHIFSGFNEFLENLIIYLEKLSKMVFTSVCVTKWLRTYIPSVSPIMKFIYTPCTCKHLIFIYIHVSVNVKLSKFISCRVKQCKCRTNIFIWLYIVT
jgi:hypothetical protein